MAAGSGGAEVEVTLQFGDVLHRQVRGALRSVLLPAALAVGFVTLVLLFLLPRSEATNLLWLAVILCLVGIPGAHLARAFQVWRHLVRPRGTVTYRAAAEGLVNVTRGRTTIVPWDRFQGVEETSRHLVLRLTRQDGFVIPRRAFRDAAHERRFRAAVTRHVKPAR
ncbi:MAG TPA: YcxB family protein [Candidatus Thermoplasmatota archaeon]|nr:YcxB family protein [Candidatus Thermoplasmatota archaeon]